METVLDAEPQTDLVVLNGDLITGENTFLENSTDYVDQLVQPMVRRGLTWASAYGNHDNDVNISAALILAREQTYPNARTTQMLSDPDGGVSNYYLPVYPPSCTPSSNSPTACPPALLLWFFDSRGGFRYNQTTPKTPLPNWVSPRAASWFRTTNAALVATFNNNKNNNNSAPIPALAFVHIPTNASLALQQRGIHPHREPGIDDDGPVARQAQGWCPDGAPGDAPDGGDKCEYGGQDGAFTAALAETEGVLAVFSGHDHGATWCGAWEEGGGVFLCFGQHTGYGGYGSWIRGGRQVVVSMEGLRDGVVETWVRLESGEVVGRVVLNGTYGRDWYPRTRNEKTRLPKGGG